MQIVSCAIHPISSGDEGGTMYTSNFINVFYISHIYMHTDWFDRTQVEDATAPLSPSILVQP